MSHASAASPRSERRPWWEFVPVLVALLLPPRAAAEADGVQLFEQKIRPVLVRHCYGCHSAQARNRRGGLVVDTRAGLPYASPPLGNEVGAKAARAAQSRRRFFENQIEEERVSQRPASWLAVPFGVAAELEADSG